MKYFFATITCILLLSVTASFAQATQVERQLQELGRITQSEISAIEMELKSCTPDERESIELKIISIKNHAEISRLEILLVDAQERGDDVRAEQVRKALWHLQARLDSSKTTPTKQIPPVPPSKKPLSPTTTLGK